MGAEAPALAQADERRRHVQEPGHEGVGVVHGERQLERESRARDGADLRYIDFYRFCRFL